MICVYFGTSPIMVRVIVRVRVWECVVLEKQKETSVEEFVRKLLVS